MDSSSLRMLALFALALASALVLLGQTGALDPRVPAWLERELGAVVKAAPAPVTPVAGVEVAVTESGYAVTRAEARLHLAALGVGETGTWVAHEHGAVRATPFGSETITILPGKTEQYLTVERRLGERVWKWRLDTNLRPALRVSDGSVVLAAEQGGTPLRILPVAILDGNGRDVTPAGARWELERDAGGWLLTLALDDAKLPVPYVIDPATQYTGVLHLRTVPSTGLPSALQVTQAEPAGPAGSESGVVVNTTLVHSDTFTDAGRSFTGCSAGLGRAETPDACYSYNTNANGWSISGDTASLFPSNIGNRVVAMLDPAGRATDVEVSARVRPAAPDPTGSTRLSVLARATGTGTFYRFDALFKDDGSVAAQLGRNTDTNFAPDVTVPGATYTGANWFRIRGQVVTVDGDAVLRVNVWPEGTPEPAGWMVTHTDSGGPVNLNAGGTGFRNFQAGYATADRKEVFFDDLRMVAVSATPTEQAGYWRIEPGRRSFERAGPDLSAIAPNGTGWVLPAEGAGTGTGFPAGNWTFQVVTEGDGSGARLGVRMHKVTSIAGGFGTYDPIATGEDPATELRTATATAKSVTIAAPAFRLEPGERLYFELFANQTTALAGSTAAATRLVFEAGQPTAPIASITGHPDPDDVRPTLVSGTVDGTAVSLAFSEPLDEGSVPAASAFAVEGSVTGAHTIPGAVTVSGSTVSFTLGETVAGGETVTVQYTQAGTSRLRDPALNEVDSFGPTVISNDTETDPPTFVSGTVDGDAVSVTFSEPLDETSTPAGSAFTVTGTTSGAIAGTGTVSIAGAVVTLTLASPVLEGETLELAYVNPGVDPIRDLALNEAADFSGAPLTNLTDTTAPSFVSGTADQTAVSLTFDEDLDAGSVPDGAAFTVTGSDSGPHAVTGAVSIVGATVTFTLATPVEDADDVTVSYDPALAGGNPLRDTAGNETAPFTEPLTNVTDTTAPSFVSGSVEGGTLTVVFDEALDPASAPAGEAFEVTGSDSGAIPGTGTAAIAGDTVTVTLASAVADGETLTLIYTKPGADPLRDAAGNETDTFGPVAIANVTDTTPPAFVSGSVDGAAATVTFDEALDPASAPDGSAFTVTGSASGPIPGTGTVSIAGAVASFTLASAVAGGETLTLTYTKPGANPLRDAAGNETPSFGPVAVANATGVPPAEPPPPPVPTFTLSRPHLGGFLHADGFTLRWSPARGGPLDGYSVFADGVGIMRAGAVQYEVKLGPFDPADERVYGVQGTAEGGIVSPISNLVTSVPNLIGMPIDDALAELRRRGFAAGAVTEERSERPTGEVIRQSPAMPSYADVGSSVDLVVARQEIGRAAFRVQAVAAQRIAIDRQRTVNVRIAVTEAARVQPSLHTIRRPLQRLRLWPARQVEPGATVLQLPIPAHLRRPGTFDVMIRAWSRADGELSRQMIRVQFFRSTAPQPIRPRQTSVGVVLVNGDDGDLQGISLDLDQRVNVLEADAPDVFELTARPAANVEVVLVDVDATGLQLVRQVRLVFPELRILALAGTADAAAAARRAGATAVLVKPASPEVISALLTQLIQRR